MCVLSCSMTSIDNNDSFSISFVNSLIFTICTISLYCYPSVIYNIYVNYFNLGTKCCTAY